MVPMDFQPASAEPTRLFVYPYEQTRNALQAIARGTPDAHQGFKLRYVNPATGASPMPTIGAFAQWLPRGFASRPSRCTDGTVIVCLEGTAVAQVDGQSHDMASNDVLVVPSWHALSLRAEADSVFFSYSDRPVQQALGLWREERM
jgi:gentisate 1,2-dioxygenase